MLQSLTETLVNYGIWGILLLAFIDSAGIPVAIGMDALVILLAIKAPHMAFAGVAMAVAGSLAGNIVLFLVARRGGQRLLNEAPTPGKSRRFREWFRRYGLVTVFIPALIPLPPLPLKVFVISAGIFRTQLRSFLLTIFFARVIRYSGEAYLGARIGEQSSDFLRQHVWTLVGMAVGLALLLILLLEINERRRRASGI